MPVMQAEYGMLLGGSLALATLATPMQRQALVQVNLGLLVPPNGVLFVLAPLQRVTQNAHLGLQLA